MVFVALRKEEPFGGAAVHCKSVCKSITGKEEDDMILENHQKITQASDARISTMNALL